MTANAYVYSRMMQVAELQILHHGSITFGITHGLGAAFDVAIVGILNHIGPAQLSGQPTFKSSDRWRSVKNAGMAPVQLSRLNIQHAA
uniref:Uncharacterized protein n=1 Tax=Physcomitrium patens TaxID=3218 RepID=A0A2K1J2N9_PHYPA|nr:hypothetical protein PHYPA_021636 [Physcomitrium patens]